MFDELVAGVRSYLSIEFVPFQIHHDFQNQYKSQYDGFDKQFGQAKDCSSDPRKAKDASSHLGRPKTPYHQAKEEEARRRGES